MIDQTAQRTMQVPGQGIVPRGRPTIDYEKYPMMMTHPQFQPGKPGPEIKSPHGFTYHGIGTPIRFPPVLVKTLSDEEYHRSLGYESQGKCDAAAFDRAVGAGQIPDQVAYTAIEYPKWVMGKLCNTREEEDAWILKCTPAGPEVNVEVATLLDRPDLDMGGPTFIPDMAPTKTLDQLRIEDLEAKVDRLTELLARATGPSVELVPLVPRPPYEVVKPTPKKAKTRKPAVRTSQQKRDHSEAIKAGMARKKALTESKSTEQGDDAPIG